MRLRLPDGVRMYTGDDSTSQNSSPATGRSNSDACSHLDSIAPAASRGSHGAPPTTSIRVYDELLAPTVPLSRHIFREPTRFYKTGIVFMAWLNGHQDHFIMVGGQQSARHIFSFCELFRLADAAGFSATPSSRHRG